MGDRILLGLGHRMLPVPRFAWRRIMEANARKARAGLSFMADNHHRVRDFVVMELPRFGAPLSPELIAERLRLSGERVKTIVTELERRLTFLFRNEQGAVTWAYPVTLDETPHHATFSTGEEAYSP